MFIIATLVVVNLKAQVTQITTVDTASSTKSSFTKNCTLQSNQTLFQKRRAAV